MAEQFELKSTPSGRKQIESIRAWLRPPDKTGFFVSCVRLGNATPSRRSTGTANRAAALDFNLAHARSALLGTLPPGLPVKTPAEDPDAQPRLL